MQPAQVTSMIKPIMKLQQSLQPITTNITSSCQRKGQEIVTIATQASMIKVVAMEITASKIQTALQVAAIIMFAMVQDHALSNGFGG